MMSPEMHAEHMMKVEEGLNQILASQDINQIHQIAQGLLTEEQGEEQMDAEPQDLRSKLRGIAQKSVSEQPVE